jgi:hypothetical protein
MFRPQDTTPEAWRVYLDIWRRTPPEVKVQRAFEMSELIRKFAEGGLREKYPHAGEHEIFLRATRQRLGHDLFHRAYGDVLPDDKPTA